MAEEPMSHRRQFPSFVSTNVILERHGSSQLLSEGAFHRVLFAIQGVDRDVDWSGTRDYQREEKRVDATALVELPAHGSHEFVVRLPSPMVNPAEAPGTRYRPAARGCQRRSAPGRPRRR